MRWEELSGPAFERAVEETGGVCILPLGVLEYHGAHLPLGTDMIRAHRMAIDVARVEPAVVFPVFFFTMNTECAVYPGGVVTRGELLLPLLENVCDEIARNGLRKIVIFSGHGGNKWLLPLFVQLMLDRRKDWVPYFLDNRGVDPEAVGGYMDFRVFREIFETEDYGHADEWETSEILHLQPELVHLEALAADDEWPPQDRLAHLPHTYTPVDWFSRQPELNRGRPGPATAEKGARFWEHQIERLAPIVRAIKEDEVAPALYREFNERLRR
jgi:creatinine amidohydrolase